MNKQSHESSQIRKTPLVFDIRSSRWFGTNTDVPEQRKAQDAMAHLVSIVESSDGAIIATTLDDRITSWNQGAERMYGYSANEVIGKHISILIPPALPHDPLKIMERVKKGVATDHYETVHLTNDGSLIDVSLTISPLRDGSGTIIGACAIARDLTASRKAQAEQERTVAEAHAAQLRAELADRAKDEFLALVSHEIRNPLNAILGWTQLLRTSNRDEALISQGITAIERSAKTQARLIEDLLDFSRIATGQLHVDMSPVEISSVVEASVSAALPMAESKSLRLRSAIDKSTGVVLGDPDRLQQVLINLINNAIKFTPEGESIDIRLERVDTSEGKAYAQIIVRDTGRGISKEFLPHIFDRFAQADRSSKRRQSGLGLGLELAHHLIEQHGGTIQAMSDGEGCGSTFTVTLPLVSGSQARLMAEA